MVSVPPTRPVTTPEELTVAIVGFELIQVPPAVPSVSETLPLTHIELVPVIDEGPRLLTVNGEVR